MKTIANFMITNIRPSNKKYTVQSWKLSTAQLFKARLRWQAARIFELCSFSQYQLAEV